MNKTPRSAGRAPRPRTSPPMMHGAAQAEAMSRNPSAALSSKVRSPCCSVCGSFSGQGHISGFTLMPSQTWLRVVCCAVSIPQVSTSTHGNTFMSNPIMVG